MIHLFRNIKGSGRNGRLAKSVPLDNKPLIIEKFEVFVTADAGGTKIVLDDKYRHFRPIGNYNRSRNPFFGVNIMITGDSNTFETGFFK